MPLGAGAASLAEKLIAGMENLDVVAEAATAYRNKLVAGGWSAASADQLAGAVLATLQHVVLLGKAPGQ